MCVVCVWCVCVIAHMEMLAFTQTRGVMHQVLAIQSLPACFRKQVLTLAWDSLRRVVCLVSLGNASLHFIRADVLSVCYDTKSFDVGLGIQPRFSQQGLYQLDPSLQPLCLLLRLRLKNPSNSNKKSSKCDLKIFISI